MVVVLPVEGGWRGVGGQRGPEGWHQVLGRVDRVAFLRGVGLGGERRSGGGGGGVEGSSLSSSVGFFSPPPDVEARTGLRASCQSTAVSSASTPRRGAEASVWSGFVLPPPTTV